MIMFSLGEIICGPHMNILYTIIIASTCLLGLKCINVDESDGHPDSIRYA